MAVIRLCVILLIGLNLIFVAEVSSQRFENRRVWLEIDSTVNPEQEHKATVFFLHSIGELAVSMKEWIRFLLLRHTFNHIKMVFPNAPISYYGPMMGSRRQSWMDDEGVHPRYKENLKDTYEISFHDLENIILEETVRANLTMDQIIIGGYGQGGKMALHMGYRRFHDIAGVFALSTCLAEDSIVYKDLTKSKPPKLPPLYMVNGAFDDYVRLEWGRHTYQKLQHFGVQGEWICDSNLTHEITMNELILLRRWIKDRLATT